ncbi:MAG TPA: hypothetical protein VEL51_16220 [Vicinamibacterales bacterium]|nr:hypothetical protein [Vicinamibacterales bacterium]
MSTARSAGFAFVCAVVMAAILVPALRAQRNAPVERRERDVRTLAQQKINGRVLAAIYHRRGDAKGRVVPIDSTRIQVDRHGRALVDVRASVEPGLEKKIKALGGIVVSTSRTYDSIVGWMPLQSLERLAADRNVRAIEPAQ